MPTTLIIGNRNYSSWSLRAWLMLRHCRDDFDIVRLALDTPEFAAQIGQYSQSRRVPVLQDDGQVIWDSLAIGEYLAEDYPQLWPQDRSQRALARSVSAEMHSGFEALREELPMNCRARHRHVRPSTKALADIARVQAIWGQCRASNKSSGNWLFGEFSIADAMYAPVVLRFLTYDVKLDSVADAYVAAVARSEPVREWCELAETETETIPAEERGG